MRLLQCSAFVLGGCLAACTSRPPAKPAPEVRLPTAPTAIHAQSAGGTPAPAMHGYRTVVHGDTTLYCRSEPKTGSIVLKSEVCLTAEQVRLQQDETQRLLDRNRNTQVDR